MRGTMGLSACLVLLAMLPSALCLGNELALTPTMGFNTWNAFGSDISEQLILQTAGFMRNMSLVQLGYDLIVLDDGWSTKERGIDGKLQPDPKKFPSGLKELSNRLAGMGIKLGLFGDAGTRTCGGAAASYGQEKLDAATFASWGISYLKYDNCYAPKKDKESVRGRFAVMRDALNATGHPITYAIDDWGVTNTWTYGTTVANSWRTTAGLTDQLQATWEGILRVLDNSAGLGRFAAPGGWNNLDLLAVGEPVSEDLTVEEMQSHFALWAIVKSPLFISADLRQITKTALDILKSDELIAVNQDPLGVAGDLIWKQGANEIWGAGLSGGARAVALLNRHFDEDPQFDNSSITLHWHHLGWEGDMAVTVRDLYAKKDLGLFTHNFTAVIPYHGVLALKLTPSKYVNSFDQWRPWDCGIETDDGAHGVWACFSHTALDKPMLYGTLPITKTVAAALGAVIAVLAVAIVGLAVGWRLSVTRNRKSYKKWNEETAAAASS
ncbi:glycoside hydrolase [Coccomyxa subellipsoidea C-169]|uniref:Alpha-galactosidase n=1 Tax=Coccomyxa subellipsoidea (strain C-169) TaxID=574566 RepID=I0Z633_COCSC|nr:glycoside hydrolase [Coccomyxa subellipsoidea C-169]EIE26102.1 glycoside hydrolase [Coccomyxa subellipsoidea C-169]|eukprot:XP_005650646.1 glycoside hydrolase [Coccomyxa subellipsoidea C-169]